MFFHSQKKCIQNNKTTIVYITKKTIWVMKNNFFKFYFNFLIIILLNVKESNIFEMISLTKKKSKNNILIQYLETKIFYLKRF